MDRPIQCPFQDDSVSDQGDLEGFDTREIESSDHDDDIDSGEECNFARGMVSVANAPEPDSDSDQPALPPLPPQQVRGQGIRRHRGRGAACTGQQPQPNPPAARNPVGPLVSFNNNHSPSLLLLQLSTA